MKNYYVACRETGTKLAGVNSYEEGLKVIDLFEEEDKKDGSYEENFYEVIPMERIMKYLIYVRKANPLNKDVPFETVYTYEGDPFHAMGEIHFRTMEHILSMYFEKDTESIRKYFRDRGLKFEQWTDKYKEIK